MEKMPDQNVIVRHFCVTENNGEGSLKVELEKNSRGVNVTISLRGTTEAEYWRILDDVIDKAKEAANRLAKNGEDGE
jgi:hypothetical protein